MKSDRPIALFQTVAAHHGEAWTFSDSPQFGSNALRVNSKIYAALTRKHRLLLKLPSAHTAELLAAKRAEPTARGSRVLNGWITLAPNDENEWIALSDESRAFVARRNETQEEIAMNYTLLIRETDAVIAMRSDPERRAALFAPIGAYLRGLREAGVFVGGAGLEPPATTTTFVHDGGARWRTQDGPYAETKEQLAGLMTFSAADHAEALRWAERCPTMPGRVLELRPNLVPME